MADQQTSHVPRNFYNVNEWVRLAAEVVNRILDGKINSVGSVTLTANQATTTLTDRRIGTNSRVHLVAETANAGGEMGVYIDAYTDGQCTINHGTDSRTDRTFRYTIIG